MHINKGILSSLPLVGLGWVSDVCGCGLAYLLVSCEPFFGQALILCAGPSVVCVGVDAYSSARSEQSRHLYILRIHQADEVFHYYVHAVFVEVAVVAEAEKVELQALGFRLLLSTIFTSGM